MVSGMAAYGNVWAGASDREFSVEVFRASKLKGLERQLLEWERYGFLSWTAP